MNKFLSVSLVALLLMPSCAVVQSARDKLANMSESDFQTLKTNTILIGVAGGEKLREVLLDKPDTLGDVDILTAQLYAAIQSDTISTSDLARYVVERLGSKMDPKYREYLDDGVKLLDSAVGQIRIGLDGKFTPREKELAGSLLFGIHRGLSQQ